jgi:single-stranded DNA-binding protein
MWRPPDPLDAVVVWRDQAEHAAESLAKGSRVVVVGRLQQRSWTAEDGSARSTVEGHRRRAGAKPTVGNGDHDRDDEEPGPLASSTSDATTGMQVQEEQHAGVPLLVNRRS